MLRHRRQEEQQLPARMLSWRERGSPSAGEPLPGPVRREQEGGGMWKGLGPGHTASFFIGI